MGEIRYPVELTGTLCLNIGVHFLQISHLYKALKLKNDSRNQSACSTDILSNVKNTMYHSSLTCLFTHNLNTSASEACQLFHQTFTDVFTLLFFPSASPPPPTYLAASHSYCSLGLPPSVFPHGAVIHGQSTITYRQHTWLYGYLSWIFSGRFKTLKPTTDTKSYNFIMVFCSVSIILKYSNLNPFSATYFYP